MVTPYWEQPGKCHHPGGETAPSRCGWCGEQSGWVTVFSFKWPYIPAAPKLSIWQRIRAWIIGATPSGLRIVPYLPQDSECWSGFVQWLTDLVSAFASQISSVRLWGWPSGA